jgi:hypothetical protein
VLGVERVEALGTVEAEYLDAVVVLGVYGHGA